MVFNLRVTVQIPKNTKTGTLSRGVVSPSTPGHNSYLRTFLCLHVSGAPPSPRHRSWPGCPPFQMREQIFNRPFFPNSFTSLHPNILTLLIFGSSKLHLQAILVNVYVSLSICLSIYLSIYLGAASKKSGTFGLPPPPSCGQSTTFCGKFFICLESPDTEK